MTQIITSLHYLNDDIIEEKIAERDFECIVSPEFEFSGETYRVLIDGNHSFAAACRAGATPEFIEASATDHDGVGLLTGGDIEGFLALMHMGEGDYINAATRAYVW